MKTDNLIEAHKNLEKFTINDVAESEVRKQNSQGLNIVLPSETLYDRIANMVDHRKVVLDRKVDILYNHYSDSKFVQEFALDQIKESHYLNLLKYLSISGLIGYNAYTSIFGKAPFVKLPGLVVGVLGIHSATRYITNNMLEKKLETPWKIHTTRMSKGLGPTNVRWNEHDEYYKKSRYLNNTKEQMDYLYMDAEKPMILSIYKKLCKPQLNHPFVVERLDTSIRLLYKQTYVNKNEEKFYKDPSDPTKILSTTELKAASEGLNIKDKTFTELRNEAIKKSNSIYTIHKRQTDQDLPTFEARVPEEVGENGFINNKIDYFYPLRFADGKDYEPEYVSLLENNPINADKITLEKFFWDVDRNLELKDLLKKVHYMKTNGASESEITSVVNDFNLLMEKKKEAYDMSKLKVISEVERETVLVHSNLEENHLRKYFDFISNNKIEMLKEQEKSDHDFDFEINPNSYDPWEEYKLTYKDLFTKGRKYFIIQSIPEWKFLQVRKPTPKVLDKLVDKNKGEKYRDMQDSVFEILALERYHKERKTKENRFHQEQQSHRI